MPFFRARALSLRSAWLERQKLDVALELERLEFHLARASQHFLLHFDDWPEMTAAIFKVVDTALAAQE
jgi:hypothetical protein